jgi:hypothetical protein
MKITKVLEYLNSDRNYEIGKSITVFNNRISVSRIIDHKIVECTYPGRTLSINGNPVISVLSEGNGTKSLQFRCTDIDSTMKYGKIHAMRERYVRGALAMYGLGDIKLPGHGQITIGIK